MGRIAVNHTAFQLGGSLVALAGLALLTQTI